MSNSFVSTKAREFKQSPCRARVTRQPGFFGFQILNSLRVAHDSNFAPDGWPTGLFAGNTIPLDGPFVPWQDFNFIDPRGASFITPTSGQIKSDGWLHESWLSEVEILPPGNISVHDPPLPIFFRNGTTDHARLHKSSSPLGIFTTETIASGFKVRKGALVLNQGYRYDNVTSDPGIFFPAGIGTDQIQRLKVYNNISGTITKHTASVSNIIVSGPPQFLWSQVPNFTTTLSAPTFTQEYFPASGDPPVIFEPKEFTYSDYHITAHSVNTFTPGTVEILIFWFYLKIANLPTFPFALNTARDFFFVG